MKGWTCGPASVKNALMAFGTNVSEPSIRRVANTIKKEGTDEKGIIAAIRHYGFSATEWRSNKKNISWKWLHEQLQSGKVVIMCFDNWDHWVVALGSVGNTGVTIFDPSNYVYNKKENGTYVLNKKNLIYRWYNNRTEDRAEDKEERMYAISIGKK